LADELHLLLIAGNDDLGISQRSSKHESRENGAARNCAWHVAAP